MAQIGVDIGSYVFDASLKTITFTGVTVDTIEQIKPIVNGERGLVIFNPALDGSFGTLLNNVLTLEYDTTLQADTDSLYLCVNLPNETAHKNYKAYNVEVTTTATTITLPSDFSSFAVSVGLILGGGQLDLKLNDITNDSIILENSGQVGNDNFIVSEFILKTTAGTCDVTIIVTKI